ncbi:hypothetical protein YYC_04145 [Plasmodium yoelii 17X]|uniref:Uncharacterized protein n=1 Tax=Plasmodium yoelii 17X TaxID=1323249 RepID=V7PES0_PLAYE|nr:hypothetical protein YYC_04145 [Plasmodium yoelii 17X]
MSIYILLRIIDYTGSIKDNNFMFNIKNDKNLFNHKLFYIKVQLCYHLLSVEYIKYDCARFRTLRNFLPDELNNFTERDFHDNGKIRNYFPNEDSGEKECKTELDK